MSKETLADILKIKSVESFSEWNFKPANDVLDKVSLNNLSLDKLVEQLKIFQKT